MANQAGQPADVLIEPLETTGQDTTVSLDPLLTSGVVTEYWGAWVESR